MEPPSVVPSGGAVIDLYALVTTAAEFVWYVPAVSFAFGACWCVCPQILIDSEGYHGMLFLLRGRTKK
jgi:hypothetical protein